MILLLLPLSGLIVLLEPYVSLLLSGSPKGVVSELLRRLPWRKRLPVEPFRFTPDLTCLLLREAALRRDASIVCPAIDKDSSVMT